MILTGTCRKLYSHKEYCHDPEDSDDQSSGEVRLGTTRLRNIKGKYCFTIEKVIRVDLTK